MARSQKHNTKMVDMAGQRFGRLLVLSRAATPSHVSNQGRAYWLCACDCGEESVVSGKSLRTDKTRSCGCLIADAAKVHARVHGHARPGSHTRTYHTWQAMRRRCLQEKDSHFAEYGGRGITICERWNSFERFLEDMGERPAGLSLDRYPDVNGNYEPGNCRWATIKEQNENKRNSLAYEFKGRRLSLKDWAKETGIGYATLRDRIRNRGWTIDRALSTSPEVREKPKSTPMIIEIDGVEKCASEWARSWGLPPYVVWKRAKNGWPKELLSAPLGSVRIANVIEQSEHENASL
ncbi:hypothetical protein SAMN05216466_107116 [Paraburkholderia phenazinium]|uniref:Uncharacterized protein n=1 Tax=Paraburkholderia phenazinium TaxID=60549 RepID=A0A1G7ZPD9_9BURK|nr:hypothetical protein [Paraburkholderia phenazinium]SDH10548.1 hypothetical protein SAMN05216466_107116 [Paraburkholderia phenazinium]